MKKQNFMPGWKIIVFSLVLPCLANGQISKTIAFDTTGINRKTFKKMGSVYEQVLMKKAFQSRDVGKPSLPVYYYKFYVPKGQSVINAIFKSKDNIEFKLSSDLIPAQHHVRISQTEVDTSFDVPDANIYNKDNLYPELQAVLLRSDFIDGNMEVVTIAVYPMQYNPKQKKIKLSSGCELILNTTMKGTSDKLASDNIFSSHKNKKSMTELVKSLVENPSSVPSPDTSKSEPIKTSNLKSGTTTWSVPFYEYVLITSRALKPSFTKFISWKKRKGYNAGVVCIEDIIADPAATGDPLSPTLTDNAGKLRQYLMAGFNNSSFQTKYALLGGDYNVVPIRYGKGGSDAEWNDGTAKIPSDLYFSNFNSNWTAVSDTMTGTYYSGFDYGPNVFVGRLLCNSENDVLKWTEKVLKYEQTPGNGNYSYLSKSLFTEADGIGTMNMSSLPSIFTTKTYWSELPSDNSPTTPYFPTGNDVITELNTNYGFYSPSAHGAPICFAVATQGDNAYIYHTKHMIMAADAYDMGDQYTYSAMPDANNGFDNLTNINFPTIIYTISCQNMPFDNYNTPSGIYNLGTSFTCKNNGGGPAYIGNTRDGWSPDNYYLETYFFNSMSSSPQLGIAVSSSKVGYYDHWSVLSNNLLGDPETPMWTAVPSNYYGASVSENGNSVTVNTGGVTGSKICVMSALNNGASYFKDTSNLTSYTFQNVVKPYYATITKNNYIPYQITPAVVYIQNQTLSTDGYLNCQSVSAGYQVTTGTLGNVVIQSGANVTFDATGDILLDKGFEVQLGATFEAK
jgi:hypothetical protein